MRKHNIEKRPSKADRGTIESYNKKMNTQETAMKHHKEWNVILKEDVLLISLINMVD